MSETPQITPELDGGALNIAGDAPVDLHPPGGSPAPGDQNGDHTSGGALEGPERPPAGTLFSEFGDSYVPPTRPPVVQREKPAKRHRRKAGEAAAKPGKPSWVWGTKETFFTARKEEWLTASQNNGSGSFYTKMSKLFTVKYGFTLEDNEDFESDVADPPDWVANNVVNQQLSEEETAARQKTYAKLRDIRQRIGAWYRTQYASLLKDDKVAFGEMFGQLAHDTKPKRPQLLHFYSSRVYDDVIAPRVEKTVGGSEEKGGIYWGGSSNQVTKECWDEETEVEQAETKRALNREYDRVLKAWEESRADGPRKTAEEYSASLKSAAHYLQPFVDSIAEHMGMKVSLLMAGPIGTQKGSIAMRSVHSGKTKGLVAKDWPLHDPAGFTQVEASMVDFARHCFTQAECEARITAEQDEELQRGGAGASSHAAATATGMGVASGNASAGGAAGGRRRPRQGGEEGGGNGRDGVVTGGDSEEDDVAGGGRGAEDGRGGGAGAEDGAGGGAGAEDGTGGGAGGEGEDQADTVSAQIERLWQRKDGAKWTEEIRRAHKAFERGKTWGIEWAECVDMFLDFERACGYSEAGGQITTEGRPPAVHWWLGRGRNWDKLPDLGVLGSSKTPGTFVASWWSWWMAAQPKEEGDWEAVIKLHGKNGLLQLMATLLWWGEKAMEESPLDRLEWLAGVEDATRVLTEVLRPGVIKKANKKAATAAKEGKTAPAKRGAAEMEEDAPRRGRSAKGSETVGNRSKRRKTAA
ncbi:hypothetical protein C8F04DRAFT_1186824 [Mycena alexandri]|uniref:Uncharacterized protein n=1 Tax=Mycena alexandri TaxID=1745969 RepID=A0AAD6SME5_9AGAR|nr:hypothetical protein C8F04DRAFT_1186824 [Mycena alexandri]